LFHISLYFTVMARRTVCGWCAVWAQQCIKWHHRSEEPGRILKCHTPDQCPSAHNSDRNVRFHVFSSCMILSTFTGNENFLLEPSLMVACGISSLLMMGVLKLGYMHQGSLQRIRAHCRITKRHSEFPYDFKWLKHACLTSYR
jgi:hypothetical protein